MHVSSCKDTGEKCTLGKSILMDIVTTSLEIHQCKYVKIWMLMKLS